MQNNDLQLDIMNSFAKRLTGAITRELTPYRALLFSPGGSIHTFFMRQQIDVYFLGRKGDILSAKTALKPWRIAAAPAGTCFVLETSPGAFSSQQACQHFIDQEAHRFV